MRWDRDGNPLNWIGQDNNHTTWGGMMTFQLNYLAIHRDMLVPPGGWRSSGKSGGYVTSLILFGLDGRPKRTLIWQLAKGSIPRVDAKGNIYLATMLKPPDRDYPTFFDGKLPPVPNRFRTIGAGAYWYVYMYGSIVKFPPQGGIVWYRDQIPPSALGEPPKEILAKPKVPFRYLDAWRPHLEGRLQGAEWYYFGFSPYSQTYSPGTPTCMCEGAGFDVDGFGRVFLPDLGRFRVQVLDTGGNFLTAFGSYGNQDDGADAERGKAKPIPLAWPTYVAVSDRYAYVNDTIGMRVVRVRLRYAREAVCRVR